MNEAANRPDISIREKSHPSELPLSEIRFRQELIAEDRDRVRQLVAATEKFNADEIEIAVELVDERLTRGAASGYEFLMAEWAGELVGFACYGRIPCTKAAFDLYWIAVQPTHQGRGIGRQLLAAIEASVRDLGGTHLYADTSGRPDYESTRQYYLANDFKQAAKLDDFYAAGDAKVIYRKSVAL
jgi:GNAT superfamily N-acetyltransferase